MFKNSIITILTPVEPESIENREIFDIRITTAARGSGEKAIRRLKFKFNLKFNLGPFFLSGNFVHFFLEDGDR